jgi:hypothetical protein
MDAWRISGRPAPAATKTRTGCSLVPFRADAAAPTMARDEQEDDR